MNKSKSKKAGTLRGVIGTFVPGAAAEAVRQLAATIDPTSILARNERKKVVAGSVRVPDALIERVADLAEQSGGSVLGMAFDVEAARQTLAYARACRAVIVAARGLARLISDDVLRRRIVVAERAFAVYGAMGRLVKTAEGRHLVPTFEELQGLMRAHNGRPRPAKSTDTTTTPSRGEAAAGSALTK